MRCRYRFRALLRGVPRRAVICHSRVPLLSHSIGPDRSFSRTFLPKRWRVHAVLVSYRPLACAACIIAKTACCAHCSGCTSHLRKHIIATPTAIHSFAAASCSLSLSS